MSGWRSEGVEKQIYVLQMTIFRVFVALFNLCKIKLSLHALLFWCMLSNENLIFKEIHRCQKI